MGRCYRHKSRKWIAFIAIFLVPFFHIGNKKFFYKKEKYFNPKVLLNYYYKAKKERRPPSVKFISRLLWVMKQVMVSVIKVYMDIGMSLILGKDYK